MIGTREDSSALEKNVGKKFSNPRVQKGAKCYVERQTANNGTEMKTLLGVAGSLKKHQSFQKKEFFRMLYAILLAI